RQTKRNLARRGRSGIRVGIGLGLASLFDPTILETIEIVGQKKDEAEDEESGQELYAAHSRRSRASNQLSTATSSAKPARIRNATEVSPAFAPRTRPSRSGPTKPESCDSALIQAIPPAAATPERNLVGSVQNTASQAIPPTATSVRATSDSTGSRPAKARSRSPAQAASAASK